MTSEVDICNQALSLIGTRSTIASLSENSAEAAQCSIHYYPARDSLLRMHNWSFARRQVVLGLIAAAANTAENPSGNPPLPLLPWDYEYALPPDCLRVRRLLPPFAAGSPLAGPALPQRQFPYTISADLDTGGNTIKVLLTNLSKAALVYTARITTVDVCDAEFQDALVMSLASRLVGPLTGDKQLAQEFGAKAQAAIQTAAGIDGSEEPARQNHMPDWIRARGFSADLTYEDADLAIINAVLTV